MLMQCKVKLGEYEKGHMNGGVSPAVDNGGAAMPVVPTADGGRSASLITATIITTPSSRRVSEPIRLPPFTFRRLSEAPRIYIDSHEPDSPSVFDDGSSSNATNS